jgi:hypothetical protein
MRERLDQWENMHAPFNTSPVRSQTGWITLVATVALTRPAMVSMGQGWAKLPAWESNAEGEISRVALCCEVERGRISMSRTSRGAASC